MSTPSDPPTTLYDPDMVIRNLKRPKGHPHSPTSESSPQKKRTRVLPTGMDSIPMPHLLFPKTQLQTSPQMRTAGTSDSTITTPGTLFSFWGYETAEQRAVRNLRDFEQLKDSRQQRQLETERLTAQRKDRLRVEDRERQQIRRAKVRARKIANGWKPFEKRVSNR